MQQISKTYFWSYSYLVYGKKKNNYLVNNKKNVELYWYTFITVVLFNFFKFIHFEHKL